MTYTKQDPTTIQALFNDIAPRYETGNALLSFNLHRLWNKALIRKALTETKPQNYLDLCAGTGDISLGYLHQAENPTSCTLLDFSEGMLAAAKAKAARLDFGRHTLEFIQADAQQIPLESDTFDAATIAYGIRNVKDPLRCFQETFRVLKNEGVFGILELTRPKNPLLRAGHSLYLKTALPILGKMITSNKEAYSYLSESIPHFIPPDTLCVLLNQAGFKEITVKPLTFGIATLITARKPTCNPQAT